MQVLYMYYHVQSLYQPNNSHHIDEQTEEFERLGHLPKVRQLEEARTQKGTPIVCLQSPGS